MEDSTVFSCIAHLLDDRSFKALSCSCKTVHQLCTSALGSQHFWYRRTEVLLQVPLIFEGREMLKWKTAYRALLRSKRKFTKRVLDCPTAVRALLLHPSATKNLSGEDGEELFVDACELGHSETVRLLLEDGRVEPEGADGNALLAACEYGHLETVRVLLTYSDRRIDPTRHDSQAFVTACCSGNLELIRYLLANTEMHAGGHDSHALVVACTEGHIELAVPPRTSSSGSHCSGQWCTR